MTRVQLEITNTCLKRKYTDRRLILIREGFINIIIYLIKKSQDCEERQVSLPDYFNFTSYIACTLSFV